MNSHPFNIVIASLCVIVLVVLTPLIGIATGIDSTITITLASIAGLVLGGCMCKAPFPPFSTLRTELRTLKHGPGPSGFKIRVGIGKTQMDLSCLDNTTACTIGPELVTDLDALLVADPFVITHGDRAWLFFEACVPHTRLPFFKTVAFSQSLAMVHSEVLSWQVFSLEIFLSTI